MRVILLVAVLVVLVFLFYPRAGAPGVSGCESKKRSFVDQIPTMTANKQPPSGMFISGGGFPPDLGVLVVEGDGLWAQVQYDKTTERALAWNVLCR